MQYTTQSNLASSGKGTQQQQSFWSLFFMPWLIRERK